MAHSSGGTGGTESNALQQLISPQELSDRFNDVLSMVRGERSRSELGTGEYVVTKESSFWGEFLNTANVPDNKVDAEEYKKFLLRCGDTLRKLDEPLAASKLYYSEFLKRYSLNTAVEGNTSPTAPTSRQDIVWYALVVYGKAECDKILLLQNDPKLEYKVTVETFLDILKNLRQATNVCLDLGKMYKGADSLYWLVHDGCVMLANLCDPLVVGGYGREVAEFYVWSILSLEVFVELSTVKYIAFRASLYIRCCHAYDSYGGISNALRCAKRGLSKVNQLASEEAMDPPVPEKVLSTLSMCRVEFSSLIFKYESMKKMFSHLDKIAAGEEEALEPYEQIDPRVMERSADDNENVDSDELPSLFA